MKLIVIPTDELGGAEQLLKVLAKHYIRNKQPIAILCLTAKGKGNGWEDLDAYVYYQTTPNVYKGLLMMRKYLVGKAYSMVLSSQVYINGALGILRKRGVYTTDKLVVRESTSVFVRFKGFKKWGYQQFYQLGYRFADLVVCQTAFMQEQLLDHVPHSNAWNTAVLDNPIELDYIRKQAEVSINIKVRKPYILGVGRLIPQKGFDVLIKAFAEIRQEYPELNLLIIGEGKERQKLEELSQQLELGERFALPGFMANPFPLMKDAEVCVLSSRIEGFPNTLLQMMALNDKVITTLCAGGVEQIPYVEKIATDSISQLKQALQDVLKAEQNHEEERYNYLKKRSVQKYVDDLERL
jgi:glycosyltransferase involved in cell wall biosynthesis